VKHVLESWREKAQQVGPRVRLNWLDRNGLIRYFGQWGFTEGAEIGVDRGSFSEYMLDNIPGLHLYCVDLWWWKLRGESRYNSTVARVGQRNATIIREDSRTAHAKVKDESLDFVYIDANHTFWYVLADIANWYPKVKPGGIIAGHDYYQWPKAGVVEAVDAVTQAQRIDPWFITREGKRATWFWRKHE